MSSTTAAVLIQADRAAWLTCLSAAVRVATGKPIPILGCVRLTSYQDRVSWWATDTELWRGGQLGDVTGERGDLLVPAAPLLAMVKALPSGDVTVAEGEHGHLLITAGRFKARVPSFPVEDFPIIAEPTSDGIALPAALLRAALAYTLPSTHETSVQYYARGVLFDVGDGRVRCSATDGHRCARGTFAIDSNTASSAAILPAKGLREVLAMSDGAETIQYATQDHRHCFQVGTDHVELRPIDARFPNIDRVIPSNHTQRAELPRATAESLVKRVGIACDRHQFSITLSVGDGLFGARARSADRGEADDATAATTDGRPIDVALDVRYLLDALTATDVETMQVDIDSAVTPVVFRPQIAGVDLVNAVMPMRL